ncbi:hypothetical protein HYH03_011214 [Edaphochlamys debaryana]|uniref:Uncharacterized protein n=1 Tax=Edaphochlamys debaryana TaxID=47281 RepID=A0A835Y3J7_9CHLO|nr:hypothetical protein HYH03_011214 [Edaphochlamys debaryana]|eukprot:KAG2490414.1 hypothetical protein HYH03_011214 [Edaphochlamys debaryana]
MGARLLTRMALLAAICAVAAAQDCPTAPAVDLTAMCAQEPAASAIGCSMRKLCADASLVPHINSPLCDPWRIASSLCADDAEVAAAAGCAQLQASYASAEAFQACLQPYSLRSTGTLKAMHLRECDEMGDLYMGGCDTCSQGSCPDVLRSYSFGCIDMDMGQCDPWRAFCNEDGAPKGEGTAVLCYRDPSKVVRPPPPPVEASPSPSPSHGDDHSPSPSASDACILTPDLPECASYVYPDAAIAADVTSLCDDMPYMPGCTIHTECTAGNITGAKICQGFTVLASLCEDMARMRGCRSFNTLCGAGSLVPQCREYPAVPGLPTTMDAKTSVVEVCDSQPDIPVCETCNALGCPDWLSALAAVCDAAPTHTSCFLRNDFCTAVAAWQEPGSKLEPFCPDDSHSHSPSPSPSASDACILTPDLPECASYVYPDAAIAADVTSLCDDMPYMPGCTIHTECTAGNITGAKICQGFTVLASLCEDMARMSGCRSFNTLCGAGSLVPQCREYPAVPGLPTTMDAKTSVVEVCDSQPDIPVCETCNALGCPDWLSALAAVCDAAPTHTSCFLRNDFCTAVAAWQEPGSKLEPFCPDAPAVEHSPDDAHSPSPSPEHSPDEPHTHSPSPAAKPSPKKSPTSSRKAPPPRRLRRVPPGGKRPPPRKLL